MFTGSQHRAYIAKGEEVCDIIQREIHENPKNIEYYKDYISLQKDRWVHYLYETTAIRESVRSKCSLLNQEQQIRCSYLVKMVDELESVYDRLSQIDDTPDMNFWSLTQQKLDECVSTINVVYHAWLLFEKDVM